jgi:hypothetical protein
MLFLFPRIPRLIGYACVLSFTFACQKTESPTLFKSIPATQSNVNFSNTLQETEDLNIIEYLYYYNGGGVATGDVNGDGLPDLFFTANQGENKLYLNQGNFQFKDVTASAGIQQNGGWSTGVTMADVNGDGALDIYVCQVGEYKTMRGRNQLYINDGKGHFSEKAARYGLAFVCFSTQAAFFDYDRDGDLDCYLLNHSIHDAENYSRANIRQNRDQLSGDRLLRNDGDTFEDVSAAAGIYGSKIGFGLGIAIGDLNNDAWPDIYVSNDFHENDYLYFNRGDGTFQESINTSMGHTSTFSMGNDMADLNNDGWLDLVTMDMKPNDEVVSKSSVGADPYNIFQTKLSYGYHYQYPRNMLQLNRGMVSGQAYPSFSEIGQLAGISATDWSWSPLLADFDNDGWKDLFVGNGIFRRPNDLDYLKFISNATVQQSATDQSLTEKMPFGKVANFAYRNQGNLSFEDVSTTWGLNQVGCSNGAAYADLDRDGDLDLVLNNLNETASIFENKAQANPNQHWLQIQLDGIGKNPYGYGTRVRVVANGKEQIQELYSTRGFQSAAEPLLHFGLGAAKNIDELEIRWPDGKIQLLKNIPVDQRKTIKYQAPVEPTISTILTPFLQEYATELGLDYAHIENEYIDFDSEQLIPHMLSTQGPALALGDVNGDGREDVLIGGRKVFLYLQSANGKFTARDLLIDPMQEMVDAALFDADQDGDLDAYLVSAGHQSAEQNPALLDVLLLNDGKGKFTPSSNALPLDHDEGSCVVPFDFNGDGALDLFVGSRSIFQSYGLVPNSHLYQNDGKGHFKDVTTQVAPALQKIGMVSDACIVQQADGLQLVVVGEWMPVCIFTVNNGKFSLSQVPQSEGWWNTVSSTDYDQDGKPDLLLGNLGLNSELKASLAEPVELYVKDFDQNYQTDPILAYYKQGRRYTYMNKDELTSQLNILKKQFLEYRPFAECGFEQVFSAEMLKGAVHHRAVTFASSWGKYLGKGQYALEALPTEAQFAPIFNFTQADINGDGQKEILSVGNWYGIRPSLGRYDADYGCVLTRKDKKWAAMNPAQSGFWVNGQGRKLETLADGTILVARNNLGLMVWKR